MIPTKAHVVQELGWGGGGEGEVEIKVRKKIEEQKGRESEPKTRNKEIKRMENNGQHKSQDVGSSGQGSQEC